MSNSVDNKLLHLAHQDVELACATFDVVDVVRDALIAYERHDAVLPDEAYLSWRTPTGSGARSLGMPGWLHLDSDLVGTKIINANPDNTTHSLVDRAAGLTVLFDCETAAPVAVMDAARISSLRTAAVTILGLEAFHGGSADVLAMIGCGVQAAAHLELLARRGITPGLVRVYGRDPLNGERLRARAQANDLPFAARIEVAESAHDAVVGADVVITATTTTTGYIPYEWLQPGCFISHVSLDDLLPDVFLRCDHLFVDSISLVAADTRRILGRMLRDGRIRPPGSLGEGGRCIDAQLGAVLDGSTSPAAAGNTVVLNPFGMAIEDIAVAGRVLAVAEERGLGTWLDR